MLNKLQSFKRSLDERIKGALLDGNIAHKLIWVEEVRRVGPVFLHLPLPQKSEIVKNTYFSDSVLNIWVLRKPFWAGYKAI